MAEIIYSSMVEKNAPLYGKFIHPIKGFIEAESNICEKNKSILNLLYNVEKSNRYAETIMGESDFDTFMAKTEGAEAAQDTVEKTYDKTIEHVEFAKEFTITKKMADDAKFGIGANMSNRPKKFVRAYYKTKIKLAAQALINGTSSTMTFNNATVDLTTGDKLPLFSSAHTYATEKMEGQTQSNYFYGDLCSDSATFEKALGVMANKLRNFKDENGETMGYVADILIIPCNRPELEMMAKKICGSERTTGSHNNDINTQYGNWTLVVLDGWETEDDRFMVMSSDANKNLMGNMFFNRVPLDITSDIDKHTRNLFFNGYCRFGVGFTTWKHIALAVDSDSAVSGATAIA
ncbi:MAG: hypothetical protein E7667_03505 [Ruminococcaceae bacterium]|nr:hypothetical protein [Oscillospiraceae bacterium]